MKEKVLSIKFSFDSVLEKHFMSMSVNIFGFVVSMLFFFFDNFGFFWLCFVFFDFQNVMVK